MADKLIPRWWAALVTSLPLVLAVPAGVAALVTEGNERLYASLLVALGSLLTVAAVRAVVLPRQARALSPDGTGTVVVGSPGLLVWPLLGAWVVALVTAALTGWYFLTDSSMVEAPGMALIFILGAVASLPDLVRLLTGRLHRWRIICSPAGLTYRGFRTDVTVPWTDLYGASINRRPAGVLVDLRGTEPDLLVPLLAFDLPPQQLVDLIHGYRRNHVGR